MYRKGEVALFAGVRRVNDRREGYHGEGRRGDAVGAIRGIWRWRGNPLRRTTDLVEAWAALAALLLMAVAAPIVGVLVGSAAHDSLSRTARQQQAARHRVTATVLKDPAAVVPVPATAVRTAERGGRQRVLATWTAPDGTRRRAHTWTNLRVPLPGRHFTLWTDDRGRPVGRPLDTGDLTLQAGLAGVGAALLTMAIAEAGRRVTLRQLMGRRFESLDRAWERAGPDWGRAGTGS
jgi:F0F1-type ATP synthase membrane subunit c/vacuolar-type H+-ATPase subunit K